MPPEELAHLRPFTHAKDAWEHIVSLYKGSSSIQRSNFEVVLDEADEFVINDDEDPRELYRRLTTLAVSLRDHGSKDTDDSWIKRKFLKAIMPFNKSMSSMIHQRPDFHTLSSSDVLDEFIAMNILNKTADNALARVQRSKKDSPNLALKAKAIPDEEEESCPERHQICIPRAHGSCVKAILGQQEKLKAKLLQEQLKWLQRQATRENLLQLWQC